MKVFLSFLLATGLIVSIARAQSSSDWPPSREEWEQYKKDQQEMRQELDALKKEKAAAATQTVSQTSAQASAQADQLAHDDEVDKTLAAIRQDIHQIRPGDDNVVIAGDMDVGFTTQRHAPSNFDTTLSPLFLWQPEPHLLIEGGLDISLGADNSSTEVDLTIADVSYLVNDYLAVGGGVFVVPFGAYHNHIDPPWIDKFPDEPLVFGDSGLAPGSETGAYVRGAVPIGSTKLTYDAYVTNGPNLITDDPSAAGSLNFTDGADTNNNKFAGGRIGFLPVPEMEAGYSVMGGKASPAGFQGVNALLQAVDFTYKPVVHCISGTMDLQGGWVWSDVGKATYDPTGSLMFGPTTFSNYRQGGYAQVGYRPTEAENPTLKNLEFLVRYDTLTTSLEAPGGDHLSRWSFGVDYWLSPYTVLKAAYEHQDSKVGDNQDIFLVQFGLGL